MLGKHIGLYLSDRHIAENKNDKNENRQRMGVRRYGWDVPIC